MALLAPNLLDAIYHGPMWTYPASPPYGGISGDETDPGRHAKPRYDHVLDIIQGYLVNEGKRLEGKHRQRHHT